MWMGVDVGGRRKGFDVALLDADGVVRTRARQSLDDVLAWLVEADPDVVAVDSPCTTAPPGAKLREDERRLRREVGCGIRWTPSADRLVGDYYEWVREGLALYGALAERGVTVIECFPTASWTRWHGARDGRSRAAWTREALAALDLDGIPARTNQDMRDAIAAAVTAREHAHGRTERIGAIVVPRPRHTAPPWVS